MAINRTPFNLLQDDDGSNTTGTIWNKTQIKDVILDPVDAVIAAAWQNGGPATITDDLGTSLSYTASMSRYQRITPTTVIWSALINPLAVPVATSALWMTTVPFQVANLNQRNTVALHSFGAIGLYLDTYSSTLIRVLRVDALQIPAGTHYFAFTSIWEVL